MSRLPHVARIYRLRKEMHEYTVIAQWLARPDNNAEMTGSHPDFWCEWNKKIFERDKNNKTTRKMYLTLLNMSAAKQNKN